MEVDVKPATSSTLVSGSIIFGLAQSQGDLSDVKSHVIIVWFEEQGQREKFLNFGCDLIYKYTLYNLL